MIKRLRDLFHGASKEYLITGAPQCVVPDANMGQMITQAKFDIIWIQYYNTAQCSARSWVTANPNYTTTGVEEPSGFSFNAWESFLVGTESHDAKLYIGLPGSGSPTYYLTPTEASSLIEAYYCKPNFGGIMIWEATSADNNDVGCGETYYEAIKDILVGYSQDGALSCVTAPKHPKSTSSKASCTVTSTTTSTSSAPTITPTPPCTEVYQVVSGDYCYLIWTEFGITEAQLYAWNPTLDANCDLQVGQILCVAESSSTVSATSTTGVSTTITSASGSPTPTACTGYYTVVSGDYCYAIWTEFGITQAQLYAFNPTLDANCDLAIGQVLCVSESPTTTSSSLSTTTTSASASATPTACTKYYTVVSGDYCYLIETNFGITSTQLYAFNPTLDANCDLSIGQVLCVSESPTSTSSSITTSVSTTTSSVSSTPTPCTKYYTVVSGDYCSLIETNFGITSAQLYAFNPSLDTNCDLSVGQVLCVSESPSSISGSTVSTTVSTTSSSASSTPTATCTKYYTVVSGDYCYLIETNFGITSTQLYAFNPSLDTNCDLSVGQVLCVSQSPVSSSSSSSVLSTSSTSSTQPPSSSSTVSSTASSSLSHPTTSSSSATTKTSTSLQPTTTKLVCNADNCLRQLRGAPAFATTFCATYTKSVYTATMGLPASVANCQSDVGRISSACSCFGASSTGSTLTTLKTSASTAP